MKTGTTTLHYAMRKLGYSAKHGIENIYDVERTDFVNDVSVAWRFKLLDQMFPKSKFIFTTRYLEGWLKSAESYMERVRTITLNNREHLLAMFGCARFDEKKYRIAYYRHHAEVYEHFEHRENDILEMNIIAGDGWEELCGFLGKEIPDTPFPHKKR